MELKDISFGAEPGDHRTINVAMLGCSNAGKTSLFTRFIDDTFQEESLAATLGVDFKTKLTFRGGENIRLQVWDTAGMERFEAINHQYIRSSQGFLVCYDISRPDLIDSARHWIEHVKENYACPMILVGTKLDKVESERDRELMPASLLKLVNEFRVPYIETSAKDGRRVKEALYLLLDGILATMEPAGNTENQAGAMHLSADPTPKSKCPC